MVCGKPFCGRGTGAYVPNSSAVVWLADFAGSMPHEARNELGFPASVM